MGQRLIITEEEKNRIKLLYEATPPPSESVVVANKNPFKYEEYKNARRPYSPELKDGDLFYTFNKNVTDNYGKTYLIDFYKPLLLNKTVRGTDDNTYTIKDISTWFGSALDLQYPDSNLNSSFKLYLIYDKPNGSCINIVPNSKEISNCPDTSQLSFLKGSGTLIENPFDTQITVSDKIITFLKSKLPHVLKSDYPDEGFEIRKIQRRQTDF
jgi:hypothetical protein